MIFSRNFLLLWQGFVTSSLGANLFSMVGILWLTKNNFSSTTIGLLLFLAYIPSALFTPIGGLLADYISKRHIIIFTDFFSGLISLGLALSFMLFDSTTIQLSLLFLTQTILSIFAGLFFPSIYALLPNILIKNKLAVGNTILTTTTSTSQVLGRWSGSFLYTIISTPTLLLIIGISFLLSSLSEYFIKLPTIKKTALNFKQGNTQIKLVETLSDLRSGLTYLKQVNGMMDALVLLTGSQWCIGTLMVSTPSLVKLHLILQPVWYGYFFGILSAGGLIGSLLASLSINKPDGLLSLILLIKTSLILMPFFCLCLTLATDLYLAITLYLLIGLICGFLFNVTMTQVQLTTSEKLCGRVISIFIMIATASFSASGLFVGVFFDISKNIVFTQYFSGFVGCLVMYPLLKKKYIWSYFQ